MTRAERDILRALAAGPANVPEIAARCGWGGWGRATAYPVVRSMVRRGLVSEREEPGGPEREYRTRYVYSLPAPPPCRACGLPPERHPVLDEFPTCDTYRATLD